MLAWAQSRFAATPLFRGRVAEGFDLKAHWAELPTTSREDIASRAARMVPDDIPLDRMIIYRTAGTTGHALLVPQDALAVACYLPLLNFALARYGVDTTFSPEDTACFLVGSQRHTVTYPTVMSGWGGAGFAKLNLFADEWRTAKASAEYFNHFAPSILTGDPLSFADMLEAGIGREPKALVTTAVAMSSALKERLQKAYGCPVIDWYSLTETGPLGYACTHGHGYHWLPHDVHIEALDESGQPTTGRGEITVTGGRNPYIPLLRYRTGDWGRIDFEPCPCGDPMPRLLALEGRAPVRFRTGTGAWIGTQDVATVLRRYPLVQHSFEQLHGGTCTLTYRALDGESWLRDDLEAALRVLLNQNVLLCEDAELGRRGAVNKVIPYASKMIEE
jgi:phenylacetate-CoA ligase